MSYFDQNKDTFVIVDASPVGISAILSPNHKAVTLTTNASQALTDTEKRYSQTEKEALAIVWADEHFHLFLFGSEFTLATDHKPLEIIYGQRTAKTSARIERWALCLQPYAFKIIYKSGANNPADYLSRHPAKESKIPVITKRKTIDRHEEARNNEKTRKERKKDYADHRRKAKKSEIQVSDYVLVRQERRNKLTTNFNPEPYKVVKKTGVEITAQRNNGQKITRNVFHFKKIKKPEDETDTKCSEYSKRVLA